MFAPQRVEAEWELTASAGDVKIHPIRTSDWKIEDLEQTAYGCKYRVGDLQVVCPLAGSHQIDNSLTAAVALRQLGVGPEGIADTVWPGRLERIAQSPEIILDGAHNPAGARALARYIEQFFSGRRVWLVYGTMRDKAVEEVTGLLFPLAHCVILTAPDNPRELRPESLHEHFPNAMVASTLTAALETVRRLAAPEDAVFITGSLFLVGEARALLVP